MSPEDLARKKIEIETLLGEYERENAAAAAWYVAWKARNNGFRAPRRKGRANA